METDGGTAITNSEIKKISDFDVFLWANEIDEVKNNVSCELFLFSDASLMFNAPLISINKETNHDRNDHNNNC